MDESSDTQTQARVLLFRAPKEDEPDPYEQELLKDGFMSYSVPVLEFVFVNIDSLGECLLRHEEFSAVVFTSQRAVEATCKAVEQTEEVKDVPVEKRRRPCFDLPCCVVGPGTLRLAEAAGFCVDKTETGNADKLADYIIENKAAWKDKAILYPCGNLRKDTLSVKLKSAGFRLKELEVYQTVRSNSIAQKLAELTAKKGRPDVVVYFSPSGVQYTADLMADDTLPMDKLKVVAIGPTTARELESRDITVHGVAESPDAGGVCQAVLKLFPHKYA